MAQKPSNSQHGEEIDKEQVLQLVQKAKKGDEAAFGELVVLFQHRVYALTYNIVRLSQVQIFYRAKLLSPEVEAGIETLELDLFAWEDIPWDELAFPTVHWSLKKAIDVRGEPGPVVPDLRS